ncbi:calcium channel protein [Xylographa trunciseda]|nr:calcium channel protein [Xylographa trunciseda]
MAADDFTPKNPSAPQSIPLQDLSRPPDPTARNVGEIGDRFRQPISGRARALLGSRQGFSGRVNTSGRYERVLAGNPDEGSSSSRLDVPHITTPRNAHQPTSFYEDGELSPVDVGEFQAAMGSVGLSIGPSPTAPPPPLLTTTSVTGRTHLGIVTETDAISPFTRPIESIEEDEDYFSSADNDRSPLTDTRFLQPISGSHLPDATGQRHDRRSQQSYRSSRGVALGDDLPHVEHGLQVPGSNRSLRRLSSQSTRSLLRSLSASAGASPLTTAGSMFRKMSQRVVNLSNQPEAFDQLGRQPSTRLATLEGPPSFPAMTEYAHDEPLQTPLPIEKDSPLISVAPTHEKWQPPSNPLKGKSLGLFGPENPIRLWLCELLVHPITEPAILVLILLQTIFLAIDAAPSLAYGGRSMTWGTTWTDAAMLVLFVIYTLESVARSIVSGFIKNADEYSTVTKRHGFWGSIYQQGLKLFTRERVNIAKTHGAATTFDLQPSILRSFTAIQAQPDQPGHSRQAQRIRLARRAFLRHSWNRLDLLAVVSFWISFIMNVIGFAENRHVYVFQMLSCLRILRLLGLTRGTSVILQSLKKAAPLLVNVAFLIGFFWLLFAIVGVQSFKASFRRTCVWYGDNIGFFDNGTMTSDMLLNNYTQNLAPGNLQLCGGYINFTTGEEMPYLLSDLSVSHPGTTYHKGFLCPPKSLCVEGGNPFNGTLSFDNVLQALELVFVIMSSNTFSDIMYDLTESDFLVAALYFASGTVVMTLWMMNLLVAVITSSFQVIREESLMTSAFTAGETPHGLHEEETPKRRTALKRAYDKTKWLWIIIITYALVVQCFRTADASPAWLNFINETETVVTLILLLEILLRFIADPRRFHTSERNWVDLSIAVITGIMQLPPIHNSGQAYAWLTFFQIIRIYRVVLAVPFTRDLLKVVLKNVSGILNLILFVILLTFLVAIFAVQLFRGEIPPWDVNQNIIRITFTDIVNSFLGMYQIFSSENWTVMMYNATQFETQWNTAWISAAFFILWFTLANFIILNMFIAVIQENFDVTEDEKRLEQVKAFLQQKEMVGSTHSNLSLSAIFRLGRDKNRNKDPLDYGPATLDMFKDNFVREFLDEQMEAMEGADPESDGQGNIPAKQINNGPLSTIWTKISRFLQGGEPNPFYSRLMFSRPYEELDPHTMAREIGSATEQRKRAQRDYLRTHPNYNVSLYMFGPSNPIRRVCQSIVGPGRGTQRIEGREPYKPVWYAFSFFIYSSIVAMVLIACVATPLYQRQYFEVHGYSVRNWFVWTDMGFAAVFTIEAIIKIVADGFFWTPNAYFRSSWGIIDGIVLVTLWINVGTSLVDAGAVSRAVGAFKALRALRLLNVSDSARDTFHSIIVLGGFKVLSAAFVSLSLLIPFAIYGLNLFNGRMQQCNDIYSSITNLSDCVGEWTSSPFNWSVIAPRQVSNPYYSFDDFPSSLSILFQIVSQEGWVDVMWQAMSIPGRGLQLQYYSNQGNAVFFIVFNLLGAVFVLTLFVSVFMRNYAEQTGVAFLTTEQRSWLEFRKLLRQISPSKRPTNRPSEHWKIWCYRIAVKKHGKWQRTITAVLVLHLILLAIEVYPEWPVWEALRDYIFLFFTILYTINIVIRIVGLTWKRFRRSSWDLYSIFAVSGTIVTTIGTLATSNNPIWVQTHKLLLVSIACLLIPRNNQLDQLFKTAAASLSAIGSLLATWFVLFLVFAIALTQTLGLTKFASQAQPNLNFRNVPKALILLFRMSCGEGWNQIMEDYAYYAVSPYCIENSNFFDSDCGSTAWARTLFIAWNITSMYIFVSMFVSLIFESFSYVYQRSSGLSVVSREEIRRFKQAWATYDPDGAGYISKEAFPRLLGELSGVFEMRIYDGDHTVGAILEDCQVDTRGGETPAGVVHGINLARLNKRLSTINVSEIRRRRAVLNQFSQEVLVSANPDRGISFTSCLMILAHYNIINDSKSLRLEEFLRRRYRLQRVEEEVHRRVVIGFFDTLYWSRQFRRRQELRHSARMMTIPQFAVPEIFVDDQDGPSPRVDTFEDASAASSIFPAIGISPSPSRAKAAFGLGTSPPSPGGLRSRGESFNTMRTRGESFGAGSSPARSDGSGGARSEYSFHHSPTLRPRRPSDLEDGPDSVPPIPEITYDGVVDLPSPSGQSIGQHSQGGRSRSGTIRTGASMVSGMEGQEMRHRRQQSSRGSAAGGFNALEVFDNSAWGESIRRSFTVRRQGTKGRGAGREEGGR